MHPPLWDMSVYNKTLVITALHICLSLVALINVWLFIFLVCHCPIFRLAKLCSKVIVSLCTYSFHISWECYTFYVFFPHKVLKWCSISVSYVKYKILFHVDIHRILSMLFSAQILSVKYQLYHMWPPHNSESISSAHV